MKRLESNPESSTENEPSFPKEKGKLIASSREGNLIVLSRIGETDKENGAEIPESHHPLKLNLTNQVIVRIRVILDECGNDSQKAADRLGVPKRWIDTAIEQYELQ